MLDVKASAEATTAHLAQIAYYSLLLEEICREAGIGADAVEHRFGWIWARDGRGPRRFALAAYRHHVEEFLRERLPHVAALRPDECDWHLSTRCAGCHFFDHCRAEAERTDDLARVVGITPLARQLLRARGIASVNHLVRRARRDTFTGCHALEANGPKLHKRAQAIAWGKVLDLETHTHLLAPREDVRVTVSVEGDPVTGRCFALGLRISSPATEPLEEVVLAARPGRRAESAMLRAWLERIEACLVRLDAENRSRAAAGRDRPLTLHLYVWDRTELELLRELLRRSLDDAELQPGIARLLGALAGRDGLPDPEVLRSSPGTVVADAVGALFALPVPYAYTLAEVSARLLPSVEGWVHRPRADCAWPLSSQVAFERIHDLWRQRPRRGDAGSEATERVRDGIETTIRSKLRAIDSVLAAVRERAARAAARRGTHPLQLRKEPFRLGDGGEALADPTLEKLRAFVMLEAIHEALAVRQLHLLPPAERARRGECIRDLHLVERRADGTLIFEFDRDCRDGKIRPGDINLLLTNDDGRSLVELARRPWDRRKLQVELVEIDVRADPPRLTLAPGSGFARAEADGLIDLGRVCVLDRAGSDVNTRRVLATLRAIATEPAAYPFARALLAGSVPAGWRAPFGGVDAAEAVFNELLAPLAGRRGLPVLNADQARAWRASFEQPISLVWGPPGTGKTYLLAWMLIGLAAAARRAGRPCRILVAAATHRAIVNVLTRTAQELESAGLGSLLDAYKLRGSGSDADRDLDGLAVEPIADDRLAGVLAARAAGGPVVIGSTVWSLWKQMRSLWRETPAAEAEASAAGAPRFDVVVIDEASQMKVPEALIAAAALEAGGQLVLCGDHRQLAPVLRGRYGGAEDTLFGSVFAHGAKSFPVHALRESRRMNRALVEYPREQFYPGLVSMCPDQRIALAGGDAEPDELDRLLCELFLDPADAVVLCTYTLERRPSGAAPSHAAPLPVGPVRYAQRNPFEAELVARLTRLARRRLCEPRSGEPYSDARFVEHGLAVISPHRAQNSAILAALRAAGLRDAELPIVDTVERMQGNEREVILVSYGVADREFAEAEADFLLDPHRFNVAVTRARSKLVVLMSEEILRAVPNDDTVLAGSMAIKGYAAHCADAEREAVVAGPENVAARLRCRYRRLG